MLSVLIPTKDWNPAELARELSDQLASLGVAYEILISDDSALEVALAIRVENEEIPGVRFFYREKPLSRSANRNFLASTARFENLLFIDGDAGVASNRFVADYLRFAGSGRVVCGGTLYRSETPENTEFMLRWKYGRSVEQTAAAERRKRPWKSFSTFNFMIPASVFQSIRFDESVTGYGHEDTLFGFRLQESGIIIEHIDNGLYHLGLEPAANYLAKIRESASGLKKLYAENRIPAGFEDDIRLLRVWKSLKYYHLDGLAASWFKIRRNRIEKRLLGNNPSLLLLDLYKLGAISSID